MSRDEIYLLEQMLTRARSAGGPDAPAEARALERAIERMTTTGCAYCGHSVTRGADPAAERAAMQAHMLSCAAHPLGQALAEIERLKAELAKAGRAA